MKFYQSKTNWFNLIMTVVGIATALQGNSTLEKWSPVLGVVVIIGNTVLRNFFTSQPIV